MPHNTPEKRKAYLASRKEHIQRRRRSEWASNKERYRLDPEYRAYIAERNRRWRQKNQKQANEICYRLRAKRKAFVNAYKAAHPCIRCGEADIRCLDFHHRDPSTKEHLPAMMAARGLREDTIMAEIAKCDILCANCHRKLHAEKRDAD